MPSSQKSPENPEMRIRELQNLLSDANKRYYQEGITPMPDETYDLLLKELEGLEADFPQWAARESVTRRVGSDLQAGFKRRTHLFPMLSIQNAYSEEEVADFDRQVREKIESEKVVNGKASIEELEYVLELKIDGVALSLVYENHKLAYAVTRGDGVQGDDVTRNVETIHTIPKTLPKDFPAGRVEVRGEVYMTKSKFEAFNAYSLEHYGKEQQNPRNTASGSLKLKNPEETAKRPLDFFAYNLLGDASTLSHRENLERLHKAKFPVYAGGVPGTKPHHVRCIRTGRRGFHRNTDHRPARSDR
jgi:DNA ligase (NAD+)